jgi:hypothetical protein
MPLMTSRRAEGQTASSSVQARLPESTALTSDLALSAVSLTFISVAGAD